MFLCTMRVYALLLVAGLAGLAEPAAWRGRLPPKPHALAHKEGCYIEEIKDVIPFGEEASPAGSCQRIACERRFLDYASCDVVIEGPACQVVAASPGLAYPDCCPFVKCDENNLIS